MKIIKNIKEFTKDVITNNLGFENVSQYDRELIQAYLLNKNFPKTEAFNVKEFEKKDFRAKFNMNKENVSDNIEEIMEARFRQLLTGTPDTISSPTQAKIMMQQNGFDKIAQFMAVIIEKSVALPVESEFYSQFVKYVKIDWEQPYKVQVKYPTVAKAVYGGGFSWMADKQIARAFGYITGKTDFFECKLGAQFIDIATGRITMSELVDGVNKAFELATEEGIYYAFDGMTVDSTLTGNGNDLDAAIDYADKVSALNKGMEVVWVTTREALRTLQKNADTAGFSDSMKEALNKTTGVITEVAGYQTIILPSTLNKDNEYIDSNYEIKFIPIDPSNKQFIHVIQEGTDLIRQIDDYTKDQNMDYSYERRSKLGFLVVAPPTTGKYTVQK